MRECEEKLDGFAVRVEHTDWDEVRERHREAERQRDRETERQRDRETERQRDRETERESDGVGVRQRVKE